MLTSSHSLVGEEQTPGERLTSALHGHMDSPLPSLMGLFLAAVGRGVPTTDCTEYIRYGSFTLVDQLIPSHFSFDFSAFLINFFPSHPDLFVHTCCYFGIC